MKRTFSLITLAVLSVGLLSSCSKINERLDNLDKRVDAIENEQIASINIQIASINSSIADLGQIRSDISSLKQSAENHGQDIFALQEADEAIGDRIDNLETYLDEVLPTFAETEWVEATFSTLEQYEATCDAIAEIDAKLGTTSEKLSKDIKACADSLTKWVNKTFEGYYTAAQMDAKLTQMKAAIDSAKSAGGITDAKADSIAAELTKTKAAVDTAKANIRKEYRAAIETAIKTSEGKLTKELTDKIATVNAAVTNLTKRVDRIQDEVADLKGKVEALEGMIQSVTIVPVNSDGSVEFDKDSILKIDIIVSPAEAVAGLTKDSIKVLVNVVKTKAVNVEIVAVSGICVDETNDTVEIKADIKDQLKDYGTEHLLVAVNVKNGFSDITTDFVPVTKAEPACVAAGTMITMEHGELKAVEDLEIGDVVRTVDHETGQVSSAPVCFVWKTENASGAFTLTFEGDVEVTVVQEHGFYDKEERKYAFINANNAKNYIGHHFYDADNDRWLELKSCKLLNKTVDAYSVVTSKHLNHLADGMLSMCDGEEEILSNIFEYDDQMKFDADKKAADIAVYGLTPLEKILEYKGFTEDFYYDYNLMYLNVAVGKGLTTWDYVQALSDYYEAYLNQ